MHTYTVFCRSKAPGGTTFIQTVQADSLQSAMTEGIQACLAAWNDDSSISNYDAEDIDCFGIAEGDVNILHWQD